MNRFIKYFLKASFIIFSSDLLALNYPPPQAKPEIPKREFADVFQQIRKQIFR